jgi:SWI/SNF-related matrix-associated actin-dependent regulator of chromatin subfamily A3
MVEISSSDDDKAPGFAVFGYGSGAVGGAAAVASDRRPTANGRVPSSGTIASTGALAFDPVCDASGTEIEMIENYRDSNDVLYGTIDIKTVGIQHYRGIIHVQETVFLVREPRNPYDANAIRVDNLSRVQIGHIAAKDGEHDAAPVN